MLKNMNIVRLSGSATSTVTYNTKTGIVTKRVKFYTQYHVYEREIYWLEYLNSKGYDWCPKLIGKNNKNKEIYLEYIGPRINPNNVPKDWKEQLTKILADLQKEGICHNDIKIPELLVKDDKLYLVDYGWASLEQDWSCGGKFNKKIKPAHCFHDHTAIERIEKGLARLKKSAK